MQIPETAGDVPRRRGEAFAQGDRRQPGTGGQPDARFGGGRGRPVFPNSTVSSVVSGGAGGKRGEGGTPCRPSAQQQQQQWRGERPGSGLHPGNSDEEDGGDGSRKKLRLSKEQSAVLEESFKEHNTLNPKQKMALAKQLNLRPRQVEVWFQNRRARTKLKQTEVDCEFLKRCCENLTEENRRLQKEVHELRALKLSPQFYMHMTPPTTLTMCPSCERVAVSSSSSSSSGGPVSAVVPRPRRQLITSVTTLVAASPTIIRSSPCSSSTIFITNRRPANSSQPPHADSRSRRRTVATLAADPPLVNKGIQEVQGSEEKIEERVPGRPRPPQQGTPLATGSRTSGGT
ncbi:unnamed protein product [Spirodela intermedia]|uniref:Homeobox domain-containing protein n=1 Tax=Spirodela intermedia TaxID=51605 RepID=A0A7I8IH72_SPIIN|nr:unnamed protein product [Spirodela intermedia]CAA6657064.1 unnamed protein product [Spirodela intermedia]